MSASTLMNEEIYDNHTLYIECGKTSEEDLVNELQGMMKEKKVNGKFFINYVVNKLGIPVGYAHVYCVEPQLYNLFLQRKQDITDNIVFGPEGRSVVSEYKFKHNITIYPAYVVVRPGIRNDAICCASLPLGIEKKDLMGVFSVYGVTSIDISNKKRFTVINFTKNTCTGLFALLMTKKIYINGKIVFFNNYH